jgi:hypothetical protein
MLSGRRHPEDDRRQDARRVSGAEKGDDRDQVNEGRKGLHQVENRLGRPIGAH